MYIYLDKLVDDLKKKFHMDSWNIQDAILITGIRRLPINDKAALGHLYSDVIYLCEYEDLYRMGPDVQKAPLLCAMRGEESPDRVFIGNRSIIAVYSTTIEELLFYINSRIYAYGSHSSEILEISQKLLRCRSINELFSSGYDALNNPILAVDSNMKILNGTPAGIVQHPLYNRIMSADYFPVSYCDRVEISAQWAKNDLPELQEQDKACNLPRLITKKMNVSGKMLGFILAIELNQRFQLQDLYILALLGNLIAVQQAMLPNYLHLVKNDVGQFFRNILENTEQPSQRELDRRAGELKIQLQPNLRFLLIAEKEPRPGPGPQVDLLIREAEHALPGSYGFLFRNTVNMVYTYPKNRDRVHEFDALEALLRGNQMVAGISDEFRSLLDLRRYSFQAVKALDLGSSSHSESPMYFYKDYTLFHMLEESRASGFFFGYTIPEFQNLVDYCKQNGYDLMNTLRIYLDTRCSKSATAERMGLHPHTVRYRVEQIRQILGADPEDSNTMINLAISLKMYDLQTRDAKSGRSDAQG